MICQKCKREFKERDIEESHDIPCYLFIYNGNRKGQKQEADKFERRWLCKKCHREYEKLLNSLLKIKTLEFSRGYFNG